MLIDFCNSFIIHKAQIFFVSVTALSNNNTASLQQKFGI